MPRVAKNKLKTEEGQSAFALAVRTARDDHGWTQEYLGALVGVSQAAIATWENGVSAPDPGIVFALEGKLGLRAGQLSKYLGYLPLNASGIKSPKIDVVESILTDPKLNKDLRKVLVATYKSMVGLP